ncbi:MAG TPA: CoA pyrophosphatase [Candidatus Limnocylindrales bacterium]|jgi:8-oxo-dGTP pyrophosphatase MutT (NUDIX family)
MKFEEAQARLAQVPDRLPPPPPELMPVVVADPEGVPGGAPRFPDGPRREAAVLILIYPDANGDAYLILTERSPGDHRHAGQISLPGGAIDAADPTPAAAALREAAEEVGLDPVEAGVTIAGVLPLADVRVSGFMVAPVVAFAQRPPTLTPDGYEVASVFGAPLAAFVKGAPIEIITDERDGYRLRYGAYRVGEHLVWGATAMMLGRLGAFLGQAAERR